MDFDKMQGGEPSVSNESLRELKKVEGLATAVTLNKNSGNSGCGGGISSSSSSRGGSAKGWQYSGPSPR